MKVLVLPSLGLGLFGGVWVECFENGGTSLVMEV